jgi:hypothetical protein
MKPNNEFNLGYWTSFLFNEAYLRIDVPRQFAKIWDSDSPEGFNTFIQGLIDLVEAKESENFNSWKESDTIRNWIQPVMHLLGWENNCRPNQNPIIENTSFIIEENCKRKTYRPDLIYVDKQEYKKYITQENDPEKKLRESRNKKTGSLMVVEAKYWDRLQKYQSGEKKASKSREDSAVDDTNGMLLPDDQILKYMDILNNDFGILTDGKTWRLFHREMSKGSTKKRFFEFDLGNLASDIPNITNPKTRERFTANAKYFYHLFCKNSIVQTGRETPLAFQLLEHSKKYALNVIEDIKRKFVTSMTHLCNGMILDLDKNIDLSGIRSVAESHLFNILFIRSCEIRRVLPINDRLYFRISLYSLVEMLSAIDFDPAKDLDIFLPDLKKEFGEKFTYDGSDIYERLMRLYMIIHGGTGKENNFGFEIEGFKESVFTKDEWKFANRIKVPNKQMLLTIFSLNFVEADAGGKNYQQIPYNYFTPIQLGSIYESFLEFKIEKAPTDLIFHQGKWKPGRVDSKHATKLRLVDEHRIRKGELYFANDNSERKSAGAYYTPDHIVRYIIEKCLKPLTDGKNSKELLKLSVCDPAMGSGHFLSGALEFLTDAYKEALHVEKIDDIEETPEELGRLVLNSCVYGADINPRAVKLAKMSLWLLTACPGQKLECLDDQLVVGDSLLSVNWHKSFYEVFDSKNAGFSAVLGNPPYLSCKKIPDDLAERYKLEYATATGQYDLFCLFVELARKICGNGVYSFVLPDTILFLSAYSDTRKIFYKEMTDLYLWGDGQFEDATVSVCTPICYAGREPDSFAFGSVETKKVLTIDRADFPQEFYPKMTEALIKFERKVNRDFVRLSEISSIKRGEEISKANLKEERSAKTLACVVANEISDGSVRSKSRYFIESSKVKKRELHGGSRIVSQRIRNPSLPRRIIAAPLANDKVAIANVAVTKANDENDAKFVLSILNSRLINYYFSKKYIDVNVNEGKLNDIPIPKGYRGSPLYKKIVETVAKVSGSIFESDKLNNLIEELYSIDKQLSSEIDGYTKLVGKAVELDEELDDAS